METYEPWMQALVLATQGKPVMWTAPHHREMWWITYTPSPLVHGGNSRPENLQTLCLRCNRKKGSRDLREDPSDQANG